MFLKGNDSRSFLQGQSTCDVRLLSPKCSLHGLLCTPKGRVLTDFLLIDFEQHGIALRIKKELAKITNLTLKKYAAFSQVKFSQDLKDWQVAGCWGKEAKDVIFRILGKKANGKGSKIHTKNVHAIQIDHAGEHFECIFSPKDDNELLKDFLETCNEGNEIRWEEELIKLGISRLDLTSSEEYVPQVLNYDLSDFISFENGCYTGQEIVARLKYRGTPKRRSFFASSEKTPGIIPGAPIYFADTNQIAGVVINAASSSSKSISALISISEKAISAELHVCTPNGPKFTLGILPYEVGFS